MKGFRFSFKTKTILILLFFGIVPLLLNGFFILSQLESYLKNKTIQNLEEIERLVAVQIEDFVAEAFNNVIFLFKTPVFSSLTVPLEEKIAEIKKIASYYPNFQDITLLDKDGRILFSSSFKFYGKFSSNFWFLQAKEKKEVIISDIYAVLDPTRPTLSFFLPILDEKNEPIFFISVQLNMEKFLEIINSVKVGERGQAFLINERGDIIAHPYRSLLFEKISPDYPLKEAVFLKKGVVEFTFREEKMVGAFRIIENFQQYPGKNWHLILAQPKEEILSLVRQIRKQIYFFLFLSSIAIALIASLLSRSITQPLEKFISAAHQVTAGNFQVQVEVKTNDEFEDLATTFNQMIKELRNSYLKLNEAKANLERQVRARTEQLETLAKSLDKEVEKRTRELNLKIEELRKSRTALINILEDVEEARKKAEEERKKTNALIVNFSDGLLFFDQEGKLSLINPQAEKFLKVNSQEVIGQSLFQLKKIPSFQPLIELLGEKIQEIFRKELKMGEDLILEVSAISVISEKEQLGHLIVLHNITREKMVERIKTEFVSLAAHQLRTPLSAIKWTLRMILDGDLGEVSPDQKALLEKSYLANERMINLINDLLNVARIEEGRYLYKPQPEDIGIIFSEVIELHKEKAERKKIEIIFKKPESLPKVLVDKEKIALAISNLVNNAIEYTLAGGKVTVEIQKREKELLCLVSDTGIGIPKDQQSRVFTKFFRATNAMRMQTEGTGLGLFITKNIIEAHGGKIWFQSEEGKGTTFYFSLPLIEN